MHIDKFEEAMMNCRFCFMCRHLSTIGQVRGTEVDTPRIRAAMLYGLRTGTNSFDDSDFVEALYRQELSACCVHHCVNHYDENGLALAARADVVEAGKAPADVQKLAKKLAATSAWKASGKGKVALFLDNTTASDKAEVAALQKLMKKAAGDYITVTGGSIGKALKVLGYLDDAKAAAAKFADFLNGLGVDTVVCPNPAAVDALTGHEPSRCLNSLRLARKAVFVAPAADAPRSVSAHLAEAAVGIEEQHPVVPAILRRSYGHQPIRAYRGVKGAKLLCQNPEPLLGDVFFYVVDDNEVVPGSVHFRESHACLRRIEFIPLLYPPASTISIVEMRIQAW